MTSIYSLNGFLLTAAMLFSIGLAIVVTRRNAILVLMGIELMLNAVNINFVAFSRADPQRWQGQVVALFVMVIAAAEVAVALAIVLKAYQQFKTIDVNRLNNLKN